MKKANLSNLTAIDHLGRKLPEYGEVPETRKGKEIGLFYYLWHGYHGTEGPYDVSKILEQDPDAIAHLQSPPWPDPANAPMLHWGEPMFGYYLSTDEWVIRRHVQMFIDAGIDVLYFDVTNGFTYKKAYTVLFDLLEEYRQKGFHVPKFCFYLAPVTRGCGTGNMMTLWEDLYEPRLYEDLYYRWEGKPLIICHSHRAIPKEIREFFTWRTPTWEEPKTPDTWSWGSCRQVPAVDKNGNVEEVAISVVRCACALDYPGRGIGDTASMSAAYWGVPIMGRSFHDGAKDERENASHYGFHIEEEFREAMKCDPPVLFLCQWNEWLVPFLTKRTVGAPEYDSDPTHEIVLRDEYTEEYSRDIEPMKGGYSDAYYLQMISFVRRFKGMEEPAAATRAVTVPISDLSVWENVFPEYEEYTGDVAPRNHPGYDACGIYRNETGRNEFKKLKVAADAENVYFYAECERDLSAPSEENWMTLYVRNPESAGDAWEGYQFVLNRHAPKDGKTTLEICARDGSYEWKTAEQVPVAFGGKRLHLSVPRASLGIGEGAFRLEFKWSDNMQSPAVEDFYLNGDAAPRGRLRYLYLWRSEK